MKPLATTATGVALFLGVGAFLAYGPGASAQGDDQALNARVVLAEKRADKLRATLAAERREDLREDERFRVAIRASHSRPEFVWWHTRDTRKVAEAVFDEQGVGAGDRAFWRCIITRESNWHPTVWFAGATGWQPRYAGTDRVNGLMQMRPYHAETGDRVVTYATFLRTSDPVWSLRKALRLGPGPFFASAGSCR